MKGKINDEWLLTDNIIEAKNIISHQSLILGREYKVSGEYICLRNYNNISIYVQSKDFDKFKSNKFIYNEKLKLVNITHMNVYKSKVEHISFVSHKTIPYSVRLKRIEMFDIDDMEIYLIETKELNSSERLFKDLIHLEIIKDLLK